MIRSYFGSRFHSALAQLLRTSLFCLTMVRRDNTKLPPRCLALVEHIQSKGQDVNAQSIKEADPKIRREAFSAFSGVIPQVDVAKANEYKKIIDNNEKRQWLAMFLVDPEGGISKITNTIAREVVDVEKEDEEWVTEDKYGGPDYLNNPRLAAEAIKGMESRPFKHNEVLRKMGVLEYKRIKDTKSTSKNLVKKTTIDTTAEVEPGDVAAIVAHMENPATMTVDVSAKRGVSSAAGSGGNKKQRTLARGSDTETDRVLTVEEQATKDAAAKKDTAMKAAKTFYDRMSKELKEVSLVEEKLRKRNWGEGPINFLNTATKDQQDAAEILFKAWSSAKQVAPFNAVGHDELTEILKTAKDEAEKKYTYFRKHVLSDFATLK